MEKTEAKAAKNFYSAVLKLKTEEECRTFFEDVCTIRELQDLIQRFKIAVLLSQGNNYLEISDITGVSSATISRVNRCLVYGDGGYSTVISRLGEVSYD